MMFCLPSLVLLAPLAVAHAEPPVTLSSLNDLEGVGQTYLDVASRRLDVVNGDGESTDGDGAIMFGGHAPSAEGNTYFGVMVPLASPVDIREGSVRFDARTPTPGDTKAFYVRFYNEGQSKPAWSYVSWDQQLREQWRTFAVQRGLCLDGLEWEAGVVEDRVADKVDRIEFIIGTGDDEVDIMAVVDNLRVVPRLPGIGDLTAPKKLVRETLVVVRFLVEIVVMIIKNLLKKKKRRLGEQKKKNERLMNL